MGSDGSLPVIVWPSLFCVSVGPGRKWPTLLAAVENRLKPPDPSSTYVATTGTAVPSVTVEAADEPLTVSDVGVAPAGPACPARTIPRATTRARDVSLRSAFNFRSHLHENAGAVTRRGHSSRL